LEGVKLGLGLGLQDDVVGDLTLPSNSLERTSDELVNTLMTDISGAQNFVIGIELFNMKEIFVLGASLKRGRSGPRS
jgi:hypothetical protein